MKLEDLAYDDLHQAATAEFEGNEDAIHRLNDRYVEARLSYVAELEILRAERAC